MADDQEIRADPGPEPEPEPVWITTRDMARMRGVDARTVRKWIEEGKLEGQKIHGAWRVKSSREEIAASGLEIAEADEEPGAAPAGSAVAIRETGVDLAAVAEAIEAIARMHAAERRDLEDRIAAERRAYEARIEEAVAAAAKWRERAETYERQLAAGAETPGRRSWWDRLLGRE